MKYKRVILFTVADPEIGLGHLFRCDALAQALRQQGAAVEMAVESNAGEQWLVDKHIGSHFQIRQWTQQWESFFKLSQEYDLLVVDAYQVVDRIWQGLEAIEKTVAVFDDYGEKPPCIGYLINGSPGASWVGYQEYSERTLLLGTDFQILRPPFWEKTPRTINQNVRQVAVMTGGTDYLNVSQMVIEIIENELPGDIDIISVGNASIKSNRTETIGFLTAEQIKDLFLKSDLLVTAAGQTVAEAISTGLPTIVVKTVANQKTNYEGWKKLKACSPGGCIKDFYFKKQLLKALRKTLAYSVRKRINKISSDLEIEKSTVRLASRLLS